MSLYGCYYYNVVKLVLFQSNMFWHIERALYYTLWSQLLVSGYTATVCVWGCVFTTSTVMNAYRQVFSNTEGVLCVMNQCLLLIPLFLMWLVSQPPCLYSSLSLSVPLVSEVIYKYRKQQEAEHLHEQEVIISLFTCRPVMMGVIVGSFVGRSPWRGPPETCGL